MVRIEKVLKKNLYKKGLKDGYYIEKINNKLVEDVLDILFNLSEQNILKITEGNNKEKVIKIKEEEFNYIVVEGIKPKKCGCKCIFCFVDQLPKGMRKTLYFKDEDYRMSYISGNYVTLANLTKKDLDKILTYKLSPLYVSVHATDPAIRSKMLGIKRKVDILPLIKILADNKIKIHTQIVLCPEINDGDILKKSIEDLSTFYPQVESIAVVPVGLTSHRDGLVSLKSVTKQISDKVFNIVRPYQSLFQMKFGTPFVFLSDEFYLLSGKRIPESDFYGEFPQIENGVGLLRYFIDDAKLLFGKKEIAPLGIKGKICIVTGILPYKRIKLYIRKLAELTGCNIYLQPVKNDFFGEKITVTGLITGSDIIKTISNKNFDYLLIPDVMLKDRKDFFLDDLSLKVLGEKLDVKVYRFTPTLTGLYKVLLKISKRDKK